MTDNDPTKWPLKRGECYGGGSRSTYAASVKAGRERERQTPRQARRSRVMEADRHLRETPVSHDEAFSQMADLCESLERQNRALSECWGDAREELRRVRAELAAMRGVAR